MCTRHTHSTIIVVQATALKGYLEMVDFFSEKIVNYIFTTNGASLLYHSLEFSLICYLVIYFWTVRTICSLSDSWFLQYYTLL
jgi:hypothetical protein